MSKYNEERLARLVLQKMAPVYVIDEETEGIVFANQVLEEQLGRSPVGENCYQAFFGTETPPVVLPPKPAEGSCQWEYFDSKRNKLYKICNVWFEQDGRRYRVGQGTDASDLMGLNRSVVEYLRLMQQLSALQVKIMRDQKNTLLILLEFLRESYGAARAIATYQEGETTQTLCCDAAGVHASETDFEGETPPCVLLAHQTTFRLWLEGLQERESWEEDKTFVLSIAQLYLENERLRAQVEWENTHDKATGLYNRACFQKNLRTLYGSLHTIGVLYADIDNLKRVNDEWGHMMGDRLIQKAAQVLLACAGEQIQPYRMGGDEFVLVCRSYEKTELEQLRRYIEAELNRSNEQIPMPQISISMGLAHSDAPYDVEQLMKQADERMYEEKRKKKAGR